MHYSIRVEHNNGVQNLKCGAMSRYRNVRMRSLSAASTATLWGRNKVYGLNKIITRSTIRIRCAVQRACELYVTPRGANFTFSYKSTAISCDTWINPQHCSKLWCITEHLFGSPDYFHLHICRRSRIRRTTRETREYWVWLSAYAKSHKLHYTFREEFRIFRFHFITGVSQTQNMMLR
jgi:hypothetical protein